MTSVFIYVAGEDNDRSLKRVLNMIKDNSPRELAYSTDEEDIEADVIITNTHHSYKGIKAISEVVKRNMFVHIEKEWVQAWIGGKGCSIEREVERVIEKEM